MIVFFRNETNERDMKKKNYTFLVFRSYTSLAMYMSKNDHQQLKDNENEAVNLNSLTLYINDRVHYKVKFS